MAEETGTGEQLVTELAELHQRVADVEAWFQSLVRTTPSVVLCLSPDGSIVEFNPEAERLYGRTREEVLGQSYLELFFPGEAQGSVVEDIERVLTGGPGRGCESLTRAADGSERILTWRVDRLLDEQGRLTGIVVVGRDITERRQAEEALRQRSRELAMLNRAGHAISSSLDLDQVLVTILEEVRRLMGVTASSVWLLDPETDELVCRQVTGPQIEIVHGWRLAPGEGIAGWTVRSGESQVVRDIRIDEHYFAGVDRQTGLPLRSIISIPLWTKQRVIGALQVVDTEIGRFSEADLELLEPLAASAAVAIENAQLHGEALEEIARHEQRESEEQE